MPSDVLTSVQRQRLVWIRLYEQVRDAGLGCRRCGVSRPTLRRWLRRYREEGVAGLLSHSRRPRRSPRQRLGPREVAVILELRRSRRLGIKRLRNELIRLPQIRSHQTDLGEFYATADLKAPDVVDQRALGQHAYNGDRPHSSLGGNTPIDRVCERSDHTPLPEDVDAQYDEDNEPVRHPEDAVDLTLRKLKRCP